MSEVFKSAWLIDDEIEGDLGELVYMVDKNQLGRQHPRCVCDKMKEFQRGERTVRSLKNMRVAGRANADIAYVRR